MEANSVEENADTIQDDASSLHSLNIAEAEDLLAQVNSEPEQGNPSAGYPNWATSTPEHRSLSVPVDRNKMVLPEELQVRRFHIHLWMAIYVARVDNTLLNNAHLILIQQCILLTKSSLCDYLSATVCSVFLSLI